MKRNSRFPRSNSADDSRLEFLARGMAGVLAGVSPMRAIERLRNMKHARGGPLWKAAEKHCGCWRCELERSNQVYETLEDFKLATVERMATAFPGAQTDTNN